MIMTISSPDDAEKKEEIMQRRKRIETRNNKTKLEMIRRLDSLRYFFYVV